MKELKLFMLDGVTVSGTRATVVDIKPEQLFEVLQGTFGGEAKITIQERFEAIPH